MNYSKCLFPSQRDSVVPESLPMSLIFFKFQELPSCSVCQTVPQFLKFIYLCGEGESVHATALMWKSGNSSWGVGSPLPPWVQGSNWSCQVWQHVHTEPSHPHIYSFSIYNHHVLWNPPWLLQPTLPTLTPSRQASSSASTEHLWTHLSMLLPASLSQRVNMWT